eukprot:13179087-Alexandrium_andersonii.AAC.1
MEGEVGLESELQDDFEDEWTGGGDGTEGADGAEGAHPLDCPGRSRRLASAKAKGKAKGKAAPR